MSTIAAPVEQAPAAAETVSPAPAAPEVTPTPAPVVADVQPTAEDLSSAVESLSPAERHSILFGKDQPKVEPELKAAAKVPEPVAPVVPVEPAPVEAAPVAEVVPVVEPVIPVEAEDADEAKLPKNFRLHTEDPKASAFLQAFKHALRANPNANPAAIAAQVGYDLPTSETPAPTIPGEATPVQADPISAAREELAQIDAKIDEAGENESLMNKDLAAAIKRRGDLTSLITKMELQGEQHTATVRSAREASKIEVLKEYPTANTPDSVLGKEVDLLYARIQGDPKHPLRADFGKDNFPEILTRAAVASKVEEYKAVGMSEAQALAAVTGKSTIEAKGPAVPTPPPQTKPATPPPVPRQVLVTGQGGNTTPEAVPLTADQVLEATRNDPKLRRAALFGGDNGYRVG